MSEAKKIKTNSLFSFLSVGSRVIANFVVFWVLARYYGPEVFGQFTFSLTLVTTFIFIADFGFDILLTVEIAKKKEKAVEIFQNLFSIKVVFTAISVVGMLLFILFFNVSQTSKILVLVLSVYLIFTTLTNFINALFKGFEKLEYETKVSFISNLLLLVIVIVLSLFKANVIIIAIGFVIAKMIGLFAGFNYLSKFLHKIRFKFSLGFFGELKGKILIYGLHFVLNYLYFQLDTILLAVFKNDYEVGIYQSVFKLISLPLILPEIINNVFLPALSRLNNENTENWKKLGFLMSKFLLGMIIPVTLVFFIFAKDVLDIVYGVDKYVGAVNILKIFSIILLVRFCMEPYGLMLTTENRQKFRMYTVIIITILNFGLNIIFIPLYGPFGAAIVSLISNTAMLVTYWIANKKLFHEWIFNFNTMFIFLMFGFLLYIFRYLKIIGIFWGVALIFFVCFAFVILFYFTKEEKKLILSGQINILFLSKKVD